MSVIYYWCISGLYIIEFGNVIRLRRSRDPVGWPVAVVSPGSTRQVWSSPWLFSLVILSQVPIALWIWTQKEGHLMKKRFTEMIYAKQSEVNMSIASSIAIKTCHAFAVKQKSCQTLLVKKKKQYFIGDTPEKQYLKKSWTANAKFSWHIL